MAHEDCSSSRTEDVSGALKRISHVLRDLDNILVEIGEVHTLLEQELTGRACNSSPPGGNGVDLLVVAGTLKKMVGTFASDIQAAPEIQKVLPEMIRKDFAASTYKMICKQQTGVEPGVSCGPKPAYVPDSGPRAFTKRAVKTCKVSCKCRHGFDEHPWGMIPAIWSRLPDTLLELVFARLPVPEIFRLPWLSKRWSETSKTSGFRGLCAERNSKLFGLITLTPFGDEFWVSAFDMNTHKWYNLELDRTVKNLPGSKPGSKPGYEFLVAHDGGLVCFLPKKKFNSMVVCNPLTNQWKSVDLLDHGIKRPQMMQVVRNEEKGYYKVMVVWSDVLNSWSWSYNGPWGEDNVADCYDSRSGSWSTMNDGHVFGHVNASQFAPCVFDCQKGIITYDQGKLIPFLDQEAFKVVQGVEDRVLWLQDKTPEPPRADGLATIHSSHMDNPHCGVCVHVTELTWESSASAFSRILKSHECPLPMVLPASPVLRMFASKGFILVVAQGDDRSVDNYHQQVLRLFDVSAQEWHDVPRLILRRGQIYTSNNDTDPEEASSQIIPLMFLHGDAFEDTFLCDLRWDADP